MQVSVNSLTSCSARNCAQQVSFIDLLISHLPVIMHKLDDTNAQIRCSAYNN